MPSKSHDPDAVLDYGFDFSAWLQDGETIEEAVWTLSITTEGAVTKSDVHSESIDGGKCLVWLKGGVDGQEYPIRLHIKTSAGREDDRTLKIRVKQR